MRTLQRKETALREAEASIYKDNEDTDQLDNFRIKVQEITSTMPIRGKPPLGTRVPTPVKSSIRSEKFPKQGKFKSLRFKADMDLIQEEEEFIDTHKKSESMEMTVLKSKIPIKNNFNKQDSIKVDPSAKIVDLQLTPLPQIHNNDNSLEATSNETLSQEPRVTSTKGYERVGIKKWFKSIFQFRTAAPQI